MLRRTTLVRLRAAMARAALMNASLPAVLGFPFAAPPGPAALITVAAGVGWLRMPLPFALDHINLWLLADGEGWTQVDCGYGDAGDACALGGALRALARTAAH